MEEREVAVIDEAQVEVVFRNIELLENLMKTKLKKEVDYYTQLFPGQTKPVLGDSGAQVIMNAFNCRPRHHVEEHTVEGNKGQETIRYVIRTELVHRIHEVVLAEGLGSASSDEVKYKYRWVEEEELKEEFGFSEEELETFKSRDKKRRIDEKWVTVKEYRVRNPEILDLDNTILKMCAKRSEVDAVMGLPGVSRVFTQDLYERKTSRKAEKSQPPPSGDLSDLIQS